jgi:hypothetical protein
MNDNNGRPIRSNSASAPVAPSVSRPRLAPNVICMFADERPTVISRARRGRLPRGIARINGQPLFLRGDIVEFRSGRFRGRRARIVSVCKYEEVKDFGHYLPGSVWYDLKIIGDPIRVADAEGNYFWSTATNTQARWIWPVFRSNHSIGSPA